MKVVRTERGWGGHFIAASMCRFRRNTLLECGKKRIVVSTVGCYYPPGADNSLPENPENASTIGYERYYETMAFEARFSEPYWEANVCKEISFESEWSLNECEQETDLKADQMHEAVVAELSKGLKGAIMTDFTKEIEAGRKMRGWASENTDSGEGTVRMDSPGGVWNIPVVIILPPKPLEVTGYRSDNKDCTCVAARSACGPTNRNIFSCRPVTLVEKEEK